MSTYCPICDGNGGVAGKCFGCGKAFLSVAPDKSDPEEMGFMRSPPDPVFKGFDPGDDDGQFSQLIDAYQQRLKEKLNNIPSWVNNNGNI